MTAPITLWRTLSLGGMLLALTVLLALPALAQVPGGEEEPTEGPTTEPTTEPTEEPTTEPTEEPTAEPTEESTEGGGSPLDALLAPGATEEPTEGASPAPDEEAFAPGDPSPVPGEDPQVSQIPAGAVAAGAGGTAGSGLDALWMGLFGLALAGIGVGAWRAHRAAA